MTRFCLPEIRSPGVDWYHPAPLQARLERRAGGGGAATNANNSQILGLIAMADSSALLPVPPTSFDRIEALVLDAVSSPNSKRAYHKAIADFLRWYQAHGCNGLTKATVQQYRAELENRGLAPASVNVRLTAVRRLAAEAADNGLLAPELAAGISRVKSPKNAGVRTGRWLTLQEAETILELPDLTTTKGIRDRVLLALLIGCGLRRNELIELAFEQVQQREGRWVIVNLVGKGRRVRTVPIPSWAKSILDAWAATSGFSSGPVLRAMKKGDVVTSSPMSVQAVFEVVRNYGFELGVLLAPHDLRRTFANLARKGHAALEQIQLALGHASILTTERYLGTRLDLTDAPCDHLGLRISASVESAEQGACSRKPYHLRGTDPAVASQ